MAEIRRLHFVKGLSIKEIQRQTGLHRQTIRRALRSERPPRYQRAARPSKLGPFEEEVVRLLGKEPRLPGVRVRELISELGYEGGKTILDDYLRQVRPLFLPRPRTYQRTHYRPGALCQFDVWEPSAEIPVGCGQTRRGYLVLGCLPYSRAGAATLVFSKQAPDLLYGIGRCLALLGGLPETLVWDREGALHAGGGRPTDAFAALLGELRLSWRFLEPHDPESKGVVERLQGFLETSFEPGRRFANELDYQEQLDRWFQERANARFHRTLRCRPADRLAEELIVMRPLPERLPDVDRRLVTRVPPETRRLAGGSWRPSLPRRLRPHRPARLAEQLAGRSQEDAVTLGQPRTSDLAAKNREFVSEHHNLELLELARAQPQRRHRKRTPKQQVQQRHDQKQPPSARVRKRRLYGCDPTPKHPRTHRMDLRTRQAPEGDAIDETTAPELTDNV